MMPGQNGLDFAKALRAEGSAMPILMLTARSEAEERIAGLEAGADDYLPKPFEPRELLLRIAAIMRRNPRPAEGPPPIGWAAGASTRIGRSSRPAAKSCG